MLRNVGSEAMLMLYCSVNSSVKYTQPDCNFHSVLNHAESIVAGMCHFSVVTVLRDGRSRVRIPGVAIDLFSFPKCPDCFWGPLNFLFNV